jgi:hypothetical protein
VAPFGYSMTRLLLPAVLVAVLVGLTAHDASADVTASCTTDGTSVPCDEWQHGPITVSWTVTPPDGPEGCDPQTFTEQSATPEGTAATCKDSTVHVKIDLTAPTGVGGAPGRPADENGWYNHPLAVAFSGSDALSGIADCSTATYAGPDGVGISASGTCTDAAGNVAPGGSSVFNYDATPPSVTGIQPGRPPDHNGWYNHPISFAFTGADATSGLSSCEGTTYAGPDSRSARVTGTCHDLAGNTGKVGFPILYDDTRPAAPVLHVAPGSHRVDVSWSVPDDAREVSVTRTPQGSDAPPKQIYSGSGSSVLDMGLRNGRKYRYTVVDSDEAGNTRSNAIAAVPTASSLRPFPGTAVGGAPLLTWKRVRHAGYYNVQLYRGRTKVLSTWPTGPFLQLRRKWSFRGHSYRLGPGHYRWYVWPGFGPLSKHRYGKLLGRSSFRMLLG